MSSDMSSETNSGAGAPPAPAADDDATLTQALPPATPPTASLATYQTDDTDDTHRAADTRSAVAVPDEPTGWHTRGIRMRTVVLGLVLLAVSGTSLIRVLTDVSIDDSLVVLILLVVAGALLLGGGVASAAREARGARARR
jgi:hypothetical protein